MGPKVGLDGRRKSCHHRDSIHGTSSPYGVAVLTELPRSIVRKRVESKVLETKADVKREHSH